MLDEPRQLLRAMFDAAVGAASPELRVPAHLPPPPEGRTVVVGAGKASAAMAKAVEARPGPLNGLVVTRYGRAVPCERIEVVEASHPVPDENGHRAAGRVLERVRGPGPDDLVLVLVLVLVSGGGSALLSPPAPGLIWGRRGDAVGGVGGRAVPAVAASMMDRIIAVAKGDRSYCRPMADVARPEPSATMPDAICACMRQVTSLLPVAAVVTYTNSGWSSLRESRERPAAPVLSMAASAETARRLTLAWRVHSVQVPAIGTVYEMSAHAGETTAGEGFAAKRDTIVVAAGTPIGVSGTTNMLKVLVA